jgi:hypothetical protein
MNKFALALAGFALCTTSVASAQTGQPDHLIPETSLLTGGGDMERVGARNAYLFRAFEDGFTYDVHVRALVLPSFGPEYLVGIRRLGDEMKPTGYEAFVLRAPKRGFFKYKNDEDLKRNGPPKPPDQVTVFRCNRRIDATLANRIFAVWRAVLLRTHYDAEGHLGLDGVEFHFYAKGEAQDLAGWIWSPSEETSPGALANLADGLVAYCDGKATDENLLSKAEGLRIRLSR